MSSGSSLASSTLHRYTPLRARHAVGLPVLEDHRPHAAVTNNDAEVGQVEGAAARAENGAAGVDGGEVAHGSGRGREEALTCSAGGGIGEGAAGNGRAGARHHWGGWSGEGRCGLHGEGRARKALEVEALAIKASHRVGERGAHRTGERGMGATRVAAGPLGKAGKVEAVATGEVEPLAHAGGCDTVAWKISSTVHQATRSTLHVKADGARMLLRWGVRPVCGGEAASGAEEVTEVGDRVKWGKGAKVTPWGRQRQGAID